MSIPNPSDPLPSSGQSSSDAPAKSATSSTPAPTTSESPQISPEVTAQVQPLAQEMLRQQQQMLRQQMGFQFQVSPAEDPILRHVTPEIISQAITAQVKKDGNDFELKKIDHTGDLHTKLLVAGIVAAVLVLVDHQTPIDGVGRNLVS